MLFDYESGIPEIFMRKGGYLPGSIAKSGCEVVEPMSSANTDTEMEHGSVVKRNIEGVVPFVSVIEE